MSVIETSAATVCKNCEATFEGNFCPNCSQKAGTHRFTLKHFAHEFFHALTHTDKGILFLIKELSFRPGKVAIEYNEGKRKKYFNPFTFLLITIALQVYTVKKTDFFHHFSITAQTYAETLTKQSKRPSTSNKLNEDLKKVEGRTGMVVENNRLLIFTFTPILAVLTWLFFFGSGYNYAENLVFNVFIMAQQTFLFLPFCILPFLINPDWVVSIFFIYTLIALIYTFVAYKQFFKKRWWMIFLKGTAIQIIYFLIFEYSMKFAEGFY